MPYIIPPRRQPPALGPRVRFAKLTLGEQSKVALATVLLRISTSGDDDGIHGGQAQDA
jgi:hypothetical protein